jgi:hypothetical protein
MDFGPYGAFPSSHVLIMVDQHNSWNSLVISTYLLYLEWNIGMLVVNICILSPPTVVDVTWWVAMWIEAGVGDLVWRIGDDQA